MNNNYWYQIRFNSGKDKKTLVLNMPLLNKYIENILHQCSLLAHPFIIDTFALNLKNNTFDTSLPYLVFINVTEYNDNLLKSILIQSSVQYISFERVNENVVNDYRQIQMNNSDVVWSGCYILLERASLKNVILQVNNIPEKIKLSAERINIQILDIVCPNIEMFRINPNSTIPIVVYIQHYAADNDKATRLLSYSKQIINIPTMHYTFMIANVDNKQIQEIKNTNFEKTNKTEFAPESKVKVISGDMEGFKGTVISHIDNNVTVIVNILGNSIEIVFEASDLALLNEYS